MKTADVVDATTEQIYRSLSLSQSVLFECLKLTNMVVPTPAELSATTW
jgi:hypothetical protein